MPLLCSQIAPTALASSLTSSPLVMYLAADPSSPISRNCRAIPGAPAAAMRAGFSVSFAMPLKSDIQIDLFPLAACGLNSFGRLSAPYLKSDRQ